MFPLLREVGLHAYSTGGDGYSSAAVYTPLRGSPGIAEKVYGWSVPSSKEPHGEGRDNIVITDVELLAPPDFPVGPYDLVDLPDGQYEVIGQPEDYNHGPFAYTPGVRVNLRKVDG